MRHNPSPRPRFKWDANPAELLNRAPAEIQAWIRGADDLPPGMRLYEGDVERMQQVLYLIASAARQMATGGIHVSMAAALDQAVRSLLDDGSVFVPSVDVGAFSVAGTGKLPHLPVHWTIDFEAFEYLETPVYVWQRILNLLRILGGQTEWHFVVCDAPRPRGHGAKCDRLFLAKRPDARYCSPACRKRAERFRRSTTKNVTPDM